MANELVTVSQMALALRARNETKLAAIQAAAVENLFSGAVPSISLAGMRFAVNENGDRKVLDVTKIGIVVVGAKGPFDKAFYLKAFNPAEEAKAPDCYSRDGVRPDASAENKQHPACAGCPRNAFGTGHDQNGAPTKGKACADNKILAITAGERNEKGELKVYQFKIPPASLTPWNKYIKTLNDHGVYMMEVTTIIGFNPEFTNPVLTFAQGSPVPDEIIGDIYAAMDYPLTQDIVKGKIEEAKPLAASVPAPEVPVKPEPEPVVEEKQEELAGVGFGNVSLTGESTEKKKGRGPAKPKLAAVPDQEVRQMEVVQPTAPVEPPEETKAFGAGIGLSDADLSAKLGL
jgi:hypothetical protein